ncbi:MAG: hypothetical protein M5R36_26165 [Deltaproteobacteria bacterium]|nr:hypothetical protein [Deltaproteobacteria bacterium]
MVRRMQTADHPAGESGLPDLRCRGCGKLFAKLVEDEIIIRCARCKRETRIGLAEFKERSKRGWFVATL